MKQNVGPVLTDAAAEFARTMELLLTQTQSIAVPSYSIVKKFVKSNFSGDVLRAYAIMNRRADNLKRFVANLQDEFIDDDLIQITTSSISTLQSTFAIENFGASWNTVKANCIQQQCIQHVKFVSRTVRAYRPLIKISDDAAQEVQDALAAAATEITVDQDLPEWASSAISEAIEETMFILENIAFFGHDELIDAFLKLHATSQVVVKQIEKEKPSFGRLERLAIVFVLLSDLITSAPNVAQSIPVWKGWVGNVIDVTIPLLAPPLKQIEGPKAALVETEAT